MGTSTFCIDPSYGQNHTSDKKDLIREGVVGYWVISLTHTLYTDMQTLGLQGHLMLSNCFEEYFFSVLPVIRHLKCTRMDHQKKFLGSIFCMIGA